MTAAFRLVPLSIDLFTPLLNLGEEELRERSSRWLIVDARPGYPCRVTLEDAEIGERVLATSFVHLDVPTPYRSSGPIFVRETAQTADLGVGEVPRMFDHRLLSLRAYDSEGMITTAKVVPGTELAQAIVEQFMDGNVEFQQIHNASVGCFDCTVRRA